MKRRDKVWWRSEPPMQSPDDAIWILRDGHSEDGRGSPTVIGYTTDRLVALAHHRRCQKSPYCIGDVVEVWPYRP